MLEIVAVLDYDNKVWCFTHHAKQRFIGMKQRTADVQV